MKKVLTGAILVILTVKLAWGQVLEKEEKFYHYGFRIGYALTMDPNANDSYGIGFEARTPIVKRLPISFKMDIFKFTSKLADSSSRRSFAYTMVLDYYSKSSNDYQVFGGLGWGYLNSGIDDNGAIIFSRLGISYQAVKVSIEYNHTAEESTRYWGLYVDIGF